MRIAVVIEARDGDGPVDRIKLAEEVLPEVETIAQVIIGLRKCERFVKALNKAAVSILPLEISEGS